MLAVVYGSSTGNTKEVAEILAQKLDAKLINIADIAPSDLDEFSGLVIGTSTWGSGDLQDDVEAFDFSKLKVDGKKIALFGLGDSSSYSDTFCNAMGTIYEILKEKGANFIGSVDSKDYEFDESSAVIDGKFVGLAIDADNESEKTDQRIDSWVKQIKGEF